MSPVRQRIAALGFVCWLTAGGVVAAETDGAHQRFSIAISGGASKGAYEAGLNWAILKLLEKGEHLETLAGGRFRPFEAASAAGASAGGVNTILSGLTWCLRTQHDDRIAHRIDKNFFHAIWLRIDINELLPPEADSKVYLPDDALLSRRDYFAAADELRDKWHEPAFRPGCRVPMGVTVTRIVPQALQVGDIEVHNQRFVIPFELRVGDDGTVGFWFDPADYPKVADPSMILLPRERGEPEFSITDERVIGAAVVSSAFPAAFGRRRLEYCRLVVHEGGASSSNEASAPSDAQTNLVCPAGYALEEAEFADGGLFDNLPIGLARTLAEENVRARSDPLPVTYVYLDPNRIRYERKEAAKKTACASPNPPEACKIMEFSFSSESRLLIGALGTARSYELYRETTSEHWRLNLSQLAYELADYLGKRDRVLDCRAKLPFFEPPLACPDAVRASGSLLEIAYDRIEPLIAAPYSPRRLVEAGVAADCRRVTNALDRDSELACRIDIERLRSHIADAMLEIIRESGVEDERLYARISQSRQSIHHDRVLRVSSRGTPITGTLLGDFGSFLDYKFREYDYYVGVYDALVVVSHNLCALQYANDQRSDEYRRCVDLLGRQLYEAVGVGGDPRGRYVFARLAEREFARDDMLAFAYSPPPAVDRDMEIIHDGLILALEAGETESGDDRSFFVTEDTFFAHLKEEGFVPTPTKDGTAPLLAGIMNDPENWPTELTRRVTARLVYLERQAERIFAAREEDPTKRQSSNTLLMGAAADLLQTWTYRYPSFTFAPSTAPEDWIWRYVIPYEAAVDLVEGDLLATWQPTWALSRRNLLNVRLSLGFAGGLIDSSASRDRENYGALGLGYSRRTGSTLVSSFGITPTWYHTWTRPDVGDQNTAGGDVHVSFLNDRVRVGVGTRDVEDWDDQWFMTVGIQDLPGLAYWLTR